MVILLYIVGKKHFGEQNKKRRNGKKEIMMIRQDYRGNDLLIRALITHTLNDRRAAAEHRNEARERESERA